MTGQVAIMLPELFLCRLLNALDLVLLGIGGVGFWVETGLPTGLECDHGRDGGLLLLKALDCGGQDAVSLRVEGGGGESFLRRGGGGVRVKEGRRRQRRAVHDRGSGRSRARRSCGRRVAVIRQDTEQGEWLMARRGRWLQEMTRRCWEMAGCWPVGNRKTSKNAPFPSFVLFAVAMAMAILALQPLNCSICGRVVRHSVLWHLRNVHDRL
ncbi:hypothetical protein BC830DRAFT_764894 [Chytriomyces sp. MP71]|nr:hypothetical protein BC830DRAFT_764894 [Chytriomyces sp. MP71]